MMEAAALRELLRETGIHWGAGVPCSFLPGVEWEPASRAGGFVNAANEGDAVAVACGMSLAGSHAFASMQNSGLGNAVNPLTSLAHPFRMPVLLLIGWRGCPQDKPDEPQHRLMGSMTPALLEQMEIPWYELPASLEAAKSVVPQAFDQMIQRQGPVALLVRKGTLQKEARPAQEKDPAAPVRTAVQEEQGRSPARLDPDEVLARVRDSVPANGVLMATTGYTGRALLALGDRENQFYMAGSMGCVASLSLGLALAAPHCRVVALDGDGALLMRMGSLGMVGRHGPSNLCHLVLDNQVHDSTGAQETLSAGVDFAAVAAACGYPQARRVAGLEDVSEMVGGDSLLFGHLHTAPRSNRSLPRPTVGPAEVSLRLRRWVGR